MRKIFLALLFLAVIFFLGRYVFFNTYPAPVDTDNTTGRITIDYRELPSMVFDHRYVENYLPDIENLRLPSKPGPEGVSGNIAKFIRALRWKCITDAAEDRYHLPRGVIFAIMVQESNGIEWLGNSKGDGGRGLCHMQPSTASWFGLKIFKNCRETVCYVDAEALQKYIDAHRNNRYHLAMADDRLDHMKNIDAAARMIAYYLCHNYGTVNPFREAVSDYGPQASRDEYWHAVRKYMELVSDKSFMRRVEEDFNSLNGDLVIDKQTGNWQSYLESYHKLANNYGLEEYKALPKYLPVRSTVVKTAYRKVLKTSY